MSLFEDALSGRFMKTACARSGKMSYIVVCPPKTGYIVIVPLENWLNGSISIDIWLYSCLSPRKLAI